MRAIRCTIRRNVTRFTIKANTYYKFSPSFPIFKLSNFDRLFPLLKRIRSLTWKTDLRCSSGIPFPRSSAWCSACDPCSPDRSRSSQLRSRKLSQLSWSRSPDFPCSCRNAHLRKESKRGGGKIYTCIPNTLHFWWNYISHEDGIERGRALGRNSLERRFN